MKLTQELKDLFTLNAAEDIKEIIVKLAADDELPMDLTLLDAAVFHNKLNLYFGIHASSLHERTRIYGLEPADKYTQFKLAGRSLLEISDEEWVAEAETQGFVWSIDGYKNAVNNEEINHDNIFIKFITV